MLRWIAATAKRMEAGELDSGKAGVQALPIFPDGTIPYLDAGAVYMPPLCHVLMFDLVRALGQILPHFLASLPSKG